MKWRWRLAALLTFVGFTGAGIGLFYPRGTCESNGETHCVYEGNYSLLVGFVLIGIVGAFLLMVVGGTGTDD